MEESKPHESLSDLQDEHQKLAIAAAPKLDTLPSELIFKIFENLNPVHATCAGLTCKKLWEIRNKPHRRQPSKLRLHLNYVHADCAEYWKYCSSALDYGVSPQKHVINPSFWPEDLQIGDALNGTGLLKDLLHDWMDKAGYFYDKEKFTFVSRAKWAEMEWERGEVRGVMLILGDELRLFMLKDISTGMNWYNEENFQIHGVDWFNGSVFNRVTFDPPSS